MKKNKPYIMTWASCINKFIILWASVICVGVSAYAQTTTDLQQVKNRIIQSIKEQPLTADELSSIPNLIKDMDAKGKWTDIDYKDMTASLWQPANHWRRLLLMSLAYVQDKGQFKGDMVLHDKMLLGINWWLQNTPHAANYWWNAIGIPGIMGETCLLMEKDLNKEMLAGLVKLLTVGVKENYYDYFGKATGQNLLWIATAHLYTSCLTNDMQGLKRVFTAAAAEITITEGEGIQSDYSFHQHGPQNYAYGYGKGFVQTATKFLYLASNTVFAFPQEKVNIISHYLLDGLQWMSRNHYFEYTAMGREISRKPVDKEADILLALDRMMNIDKTNASKYMAFRNQLVDKAPKQSLNGNKYFYRSDLMVQQRSNYYFALKGASNRVTSGESGNGENIKGFYQGNGTFYLVKRGNEYEDIFPVWNWRKLPGLLSKQISEPFPLFTWGEGAFGTTSFVDGLSDKQYGCFAYDYNKNGVTAHRSWFMFDNEIVNLISGASGDSLYQSINQCLLNGTVWQDENKNPASIKRVFHDSVGYIIKSDGRLEIKQSTETGSWHSINLAASAEPVTKALFNIGVNLGKAINKNYSYILLPGISLPKFQDYNLQNHIQILANNINLQSVYEKDLQQVQAVFYGSDSLQLPFKNLFLKLEKQGLAIIKLKQDKMIVDYGIKRHNNHIEILLNRKIAYKNKDIIIGIVQ